MRVLQINNKIVGAGAEVVLLNLSHLLSSADIPNAIATYEQPVEQNSFTYRLICPPYWLENCAEKMSSLKPTKNDPGAIFDDPNRTLVKSLSSNLRGFIPLNDPITRRSTMQVLSLFSPDLVHMHKLMPSLAPLNVCAEEKLRVVLTAHGYWPICPLGNLVRGDGSLCDSVDWSQCRSYCSWPSAHVDRHMKRLRETLISKIDIIIAISHFMRRRLIDFGYPPEMVKTIHNGVEEFPSLPSCDHKKPFVLFCGRMNLHKAPMAFIEASRIVRRQGVELDFLMVGAGANAISLQRILGDCVKVVPWLPREELMAYMKAAICTVIPSMWHEPLGLVALESFACSTPVIATRVGALSEIVDDGTTGFLIKIDDRESIAQLIADTTVFLSANPDLRDKLGAACYEKYLNDFTSSLMGERYLDTYDSLVKSS